MSPPTLPSTARSPAEPSPRAGAPVTRAVLAVVAAADAGLAISDFLLRPLFAGSGDPRAALRGFLVLGALLVVAARRGARRRPAAPSSGEPAGPLASGDPADPLEACLASLTRAAPPAETTVLAVHLAETLVEVFWDGPPGPAPPPWQASPTGWVWDAVPAHLPAQMPAAGVLPALVELGVTPTGTLWLNLAACRVLAVDGEPGDAARLGDTLVDALAARAWAGVLELLTVPVGAEAPSASHATDIVLARLWQRAARRHQHLRRPPRRRRARHRPAAPLVVAVPPGAPPEILARVVPAAAGDPGVTVLVVGDPSAADLRLTCRDGHVDVPFLGRIAVTPRSQPHPTPTGSPSPLTGRAGPPPDEPTLVGVSRPAGAAARPVPPAVVVHVLGPVEILGAPGPRTGKSLELVAYLACHPDGVADHQIRAALWPEQPPTQATWANRVSVARKALGAEPDGEARLRRFRHHVGRLAPTVRTDLAALADALDRASTAPPPALAAALAGALDAVRGRPFEAPAGFRWAHTEGHVTRAEHLVVDAAHRLVELALTAGDTGQAAWAAARGLRAVPASELLREDLRRTRTVTNQPHRLGPAPPAPLDTPRRATPT